MLSKFDEFCTQRSCHELSDTLYIDKQAIFTTYSLLRVTSILSSRSHIDIKEAGNKASLTSFLTLIERSNTGFADIKFTVI